MVGCRGQELNRRTPPPLPSGAPPPQAGEETNLATRHELRDGLERSMKAEGAVIAPDRTDVREDREMVGGDGFEPPTLSV